MSRVILHIGMPKTGTTALQLFFACNKEKLAEREIAFPVVNPSAKAQVNATPMMFACATRISSYKPMYINEEGPLLRYPHLKDAISHEGKGTILLTSEFIYEAMNLQGPHYADDYQKLWIDLVRELRSVGTQSIEVILYLRDRAEFTESWWRQQIEDGRPFENYSGVLDSDYVNFLLDYHAHVDAIERVLGSEDGLVIRKYDYDSFIGGDIFHDFCYAAGIPWDNSYTIPKGLPNVSLTNDLIEAMKGLSQVAPYGSKARFVLKRYTMDLTIKEPAPNAALLSSEEYERRFSCYKEGDCTIARKYFGEDGLSFHTHERELWSPSEEAIAEKRVLLLKRLDRFRVNRYPVQLLHISTPKLQSIELTLKAPLQVWVKDVFIRPINDDSGEQKRSCQFAVTKRQDYLSIKVSITGNQIEAQRQHWLLFLELEIPEGEEAPGAFTQRVSIPKATKLMMLLRNQHCELSDGFILYPSWHIDAGKFGFISEEKSTYNAWQTKATELKHTLSVRRQRLGRLPQLRKAKH